MLLWQRYGLRKYMTPASNPRTRILRNAKNTVITGRTDFPRWHYIGKFLSEGKDAKDGKLFPGIGAATVNQLMKGFGDSKKLVEALDESNIDLLVQNSRLLSKADAEKMANIWAGLWSGRDQDSLAFEMLRLFGLSKRQIYSSFRKAGEFERALETDSYLTLQNLNVGWTSMKKLDAFIRLRQLRFSDMEKLAFLVKAALVSSSQLCLSADQIRMLILEELHKGTVGTSFALQPHQITETEISTCIGVDNGRCIMIGRSGFIYEPVNYFNELDVASQIVKRINPNLRTPPAPFEISAISKDLSEEQRNAVLKALQSKLFVLTGGPGTGKTHCLGEMLKAWSAAGSEVIVTSYTARSVQNLVKRAGAVNAQTIHRLMEAIPLRDETSSFRKHRIDCDVFVLDEATLVDLELMKQVLRRLDPRASIVLLGDPDQLSSIRPGSVFRDLLDDRLKGKIASAHLKEPRRQEGLFDSPIYIAAQSIRQGQVPDRNVMPTIPLGQVGGGSMSSSSTTNQASWINVFPTEANISAVVEAVLRSHDPDSVQILVTQRSEYHNEYLKRLFRKPLLRSKPTGKSIGAGTSYSKFIVGDRVMHVKNDYERNVMNGEIGVVSSVEENDDEKRFLLKVKYGLEKEVSYSLSDLSDLTLAYAITVHKSQGCEFPVVICVLDAYSSFCTRQMLFTAFTRAKGKMVLVGRRQDLLQGIEREEVRNSNLPETILVNFDQPMIALEFAGPGIVGDGQRVAVPKVDAMITASKPSNDTSIAPNAPVVQDVAKETILPAPALESAPVVETKKPQTTRRSYTKAWKPTPGSIANRDFVVDMFDELGLLGELQERIGAETPVRSRSTPAIEIDPPQILAPMRGFLTQPQATRSVQQSENNQGANSSDDIVKVPSSTDESVKYTLNRTKRTCSCPGFIHRNRCKHVDSI